MSLLILGGLDFDDERLAKARALAGEVRINRGGDAEEVRRDIRACRFIFCNNFDLNPWLEELKRVELVVLAETGVTCLDPVKAVGVNWKNLPLYSTSATVEFCLRCLLESSRPWGKIFGGTRREEMLGKNLCARRIGLVGFGNIGRRLGEALAALGAEVSAATRTPFVHPSVRRKALDELFASSDAVVICCSFNRDSLGMVTDGRIMSLPEGAILVSIADRRVFAEKALMEALFARPDVDFWLDIDPRDGDPAQGSFPNIRTSPHVAFYTGQTLANRLDGCLGLLAAHLG